MRRVTTWLAGPVEVTRHALGGRDLALHAAAVTFYGGIALVPVALLAIRLAALIGGRPRVAHLAGYAIDAVPPAIGADRVVADLFGAGLRLSPAAVLASLLPATLYGEGLRRAFGSLAGPGHPAPGRGDRPAGLDDSGSGRGDRPGARRAGSGPAPGMAWIGWRGRLLVLPLLAFGPALLFALLVALAPAARLLQRGGGAGVAAVILSFLAGWLALSPVTVFLYRVVSPARPGWRAAALGGSFTAANICGFAHGFVLFCAIPLDLGLPFGGFDPVGGVVAVALWLYLFHTLVLLGYLGTLELDRWLTGQGAGPQVRLPGAARAAHTLR